jgi:hypothetical protein
VYYSNVFQFPNVNPAPNYGDKFEASLKNVDPKWAHVQCYSWPIANAGVVPFVNRNRDSDASVNKSQKRNVIMTDWTVEPLKHPELQYAWCDATPEVLDKRAYQYPYSAIFLYDPTYDDVHHTYATDFTSAMKKKYNMDYLPHCTIIRFGGEPAAQASLDHWLKEEQERPKDQPVDTQWKPKR